MREEIEYVSAPSRSLPFFITIAGRSFCDGSYHIVRRDSAVCTVEYILDGVGTVRCGDMTSLAEKGQVYLLPPHRDHDYYSDASHPWTKIWVNVGGTLVDSLLAAYHLSDTLVYDGGDTLPLFEEAVALCGSGKSTEEILRAGAPLVHRLFAALAPASVFLPDADAAVGADAAALRRHIDAHFAEPLTMDGIASVIYKSRSQSHRLFKAAFSVSPYDYLITRRLDAAKALLADTGLSVKEIASRVGFSDEHYFSALFHRKCGETPRETRERRGETQKS